MCIVSSYKKLRRLAYISLIRSQLELQLVVRCFNLHASKTKTQLKKSVSNKRDGELVRCKRDGEMNISPSSRFHLASISLPSRFHLAFISLSSRFHLAFISPSSRFHRSLPSRLHLAFLWFGPYMWKTTEGVINLAERSGAERRPAKACAPVGSLN